MRLTHVVNFLLCCSLCCSARSQRNLRTICVFASRPCSSNKAQVRTTFFGSFQANGFTRSLDFMIQNGEQEEKRLSYRRFFHQRAAHHDLESNPDSPVVLFIAGQQKAPHGIGCCGYFLLGISYFVICVTLPFSLCFCIKVSLKTVRSILDEGKTVDD